MMSDFWKIATFLLVVIAIGTQCRPSGASDDYDRNQDDRCNNYGDFRVC
jgi:hypothetical protein